MQASLRKVGLHGLVLCNVSHETRDDFLYYLLLRHVERGLLLVPTKGKVTLYAIPFESPDLAAAHPELQVRPMTEGMEALTAGHFRRGMNVGYRKTLPAALFARLKRQVKLLSWDDPLIMGIKTPAEVATLRRTARVTDKIFKALVKQWPAFKTERDAAQFIHMETLRHGYEPSFPAIVASGAHAASPHHEPQKTRLQKGFCVIDMGVRAHGYCSDMTRTVYLGTPSQSERKLYRTLLAVQTTLCRLARHGTSAAALDSECRRRLGPLEKLFIHGLGHGLGTQVHEWPGVSGNSEAVLKAGMVITIEPGMYKKGAFGVRIEDDVVVRSGSPIILTRSPKTLTVLRG